MEINFYQFDDILYKTIAPLLLKILEENKKALIYCKDDKMLKEIDSGLWSFSKTKFIPHATNYEKVNALKYPVFISNSQENENKAEYLIMADVASEEFFSKFKRVFYFFNQSNQSNARKLWSDYKKKSFSLNFHKKENGSWVKVNI
jgi:DNA polymerase IIIc chi subunit